MTVFPENAVILIFVFEQVKWIFRVTAQLNVAVVVIEGFLLNMLVFQRDELMSSVHVPGGLLECDRKHPSTDLEIEVAIADSALSECHQKGLGNGAATLILETVID